jgi:HK97 family phage prohead protease
MAQLDDNLSDADLVAAAQIFINDLQDAMKDVALLMTPEEEEAVNQAMRSANPPVEWRYIDLSLPVERRIATFSMGDGNTLVGTAAVFNQWTTIATSRNSSFKEQIKPGAFNNIASCDVKALFNHDPNQILGSTAGGQVKLTQSTNGLEFEISLLDTTLGRDIKTLVQNGVVTGCSFGFMHDSCEDEWNGNGTQRTLTNIPDVVDVSVVTFPAYPQTNVNLRSVQRANDYWKYSIAMKKLKMASTRGKK